MRRRKLINIMTERGRELRSDMPYITKKKFEEYHKIIENLLKGLEEIEPISKLEYPEIEDFGSNRKDVKEMAEKIRIDKKNNEIVSGNKTLIRNIKHCKKSLSDLMKSKKESVFGLIHYNKIHTLNWGEVDMRGFSEYLEAGLNIYRLKYKCLD